MLTVERSVEDLGMARPDVVRLMIAQLTFRKESFHFLDGLAFHKKAALATSKLARTFDVAIRHQAQLLLLPELSVPPECIPEIIGWTAAHNTIVVAGSHYHYAGSGYVSRCPIVVGGRVYYTD